MLRLLMLVVIILLTSLVAGPATALALLLLSALAVSAGWMRNAAARRTELEHRNFERVRARHCRARGA
jgi:hypothetical protein